ncbi:MAG TPA: hypothetical protein P5163_18385, partial [Rubrivivax sp.]|nr:hypothetical protein [Rubrivivax sp.]
ARDLDEALEMARALVALGFTQVAASPHMGMGPGGDVDPEVAATTMAMLKVTLQERQIPLTVSTNAEHYLSPDSRATVKVRT